MFLEEKVEESYSDCPYISGELYKHIGEAAQYNDQLSELKWAVSDISNDDLISACRTKSVLYLYFVNGMNCVRSEFNDIDADRDWLRPFIKSELIWEEDQVRRKIQLPRLLPDIFDPIKHSTFVNIVVNGSKNPLYEWEKKWVEIEGN